MWKPDMVKLKKGCNLKNWRDRGRPEHSIYTILHGEKTLRVALLNRNKHHVSYI